MSFQIPHATDVEVDLRAVFRAIRRRFPLFILLALLVGAGVYALLSSMDPRYTAETTILIEPGESDLTRIDAANPQETATLLDEQGIASQVQLIRSRDIARAVIDELDLWTHAEFDPEQQSPSLLDGLLSRIGLGDDAAPLTSTEELVIDAFLASLAVGPIDRTRVISISFTSTDPQLAADAANAVARQYIAMQRSLRQESTEGATAWLQDEIATLSQRVQEAEAEVEAFRSSQDLYAIGPNAVTLAEQRMADIATALSAQTAARIEAEARAGQIRAQLDSGAALNVPEVLASPLIQSLRGQQATLRTQISEASATLLPGHPRLRELNAQVADLEEDIRDEAGRILASIEAEAELSRQREAELTTTLDTLKIEVARVNAATVELNALERVAAADSAFLELYLSRYREAIARLNTEYQPVNARVISAAAVPSEPVFPNKIPMTVGAMLLTIILAAAVALVRELASGRATRPAALLAPIPIVPGEVPVGARVRWSDDGDVRRMMPHDPHSAHGLAAQAERSLAAIAGQIRAKQAKRILITIAEGTSANGRPLAAVALARTLARLGARVLLVDLHRDDADRIAMGEAGGLPGIGELFLGEASFAQVIFRDRSSPAHFIPAGRQRPADLTEGDRLTSLLGALDHTYDHIVFDIDQELVPALGPGAGAAIVVTEVGAADPRTVRAYDAVTAASSADVMLLIADPLPAGAAA
ncbi:MAG: hypothetical protein KIS96_02170 [Bauldia sp.]|nr:hypothetical protein [Bauldia sp.]